jgi:hypothetical protein
MLAIAAVSTAASAEQLGCRSVGFIKDTDVIRVGKDSGRFKSIQLRVTGNDIEMRDLKIVYGNNQVDDVQVRSQIRAGGETRRIDLKGDKRFIKEIIMTYVSRPSFKGQARVCVFGRH